MGTINCKMCRVQVSGEFDYCGNCGAALDNAQNRGGRGGGRSIVLALVFGHDNVVGHQIIEDRSSRESTPPQARGSARPPVTPAGQQPQGTQPLFGLTIPLRWFVLWVGVGITPPRYAQPPQVQSGKPGTGQVAADAHPSTSTGQVAEDEKRCLSAVEQRFGFDQYTPGPRREGSTRTVEEARDRFSERVQLARRQQLGGFKAGTTAGGTQAHGRGDVGPVL